MHEANEDRLLWGFSVFTIFSSFFRVIVKFIVGDEPCPVPPNDRLDQYSCQPELEFNPGICSHFLSPRRNNNQCNDDFFYNVKKLLQRVSPHNMPGKNNIINCAISVLSGSFQEIT